MPLLAEEVDEADESTNEAGILIFEADRRFDRTPPPSLDASPSLMNVKDEKYFLDGVYSPYGW